MKGSLNTWTRQTASSNSVYLMVDSGAREIINLTDDKACWEVFGSFSCLFSSSNKGKTAPAIFLTVLAVGITVLPTNSLTFMYHRCYFSYMTGSKDPQHHQMAVICSGPLPSIGFSHAPLDRLSWGTLTAVPLHRPFVSKKQQEWSLSPKQYLGWSLRGGMRDQELEDVVVWMQLTPINS